MSVPATKHIALDDWALEIDVAESAQQSSEIELQTDVEALTKYRQHEAALAWMRENGKKDKAAIKTGLFSDITARTLELRRTGVVRNGEEYNDRSILTMVERVQLAEWLAEEQKAGRPKDRDETRLKIVEILRFRLQTRNTGRYNHSRGGRTEKAPAPGNCQSPQGSSGLC